MRNRPEAGFTLIELIVVIVLIGVIATVVAQNIYAPVRSFLDLSRRAALQDTAEGALRRMTREVRLALPNSVRLRDGSATMLDTCDTTTASGNICALELVRTLEGGRYRMALDAGTSSYCADDTLDFSVNTDCFQVLGQLQDVPAPATLGNQQADCGTKVCMVIYNTGQPGANVYDKDNIAAVETASADAITFNNADVPTFAFPWESPEQRFQLIDTPVSFVCDPTGGGLLLRYSNYNISTAQSTTPGGLQAELADNVASCSFRYEQGASSRSGLVSIAITLTRDNESIHLLEQIHVFNLP